MTVTIVQLYLKIDVDRNFFYEEKTFIITFI